jgi:hypothetical protein
LAKSSQREAVSPQLPAASATGSDGGTGQEQISAAKPAQADAASPTMQASHSFESRSESNASQRGVVTDALPSTLSDELNARRGRLVEVEAQNLQLIADRRKLQGALRKAHEALKAKSASMHTSTTPTNNGNALSHMMQGDARQWQEHAKKLETENKRMHLELHQAMLILAAACAGDSIQIEPCSEFVNELYSFLNSAVSSAKHHNSLVSETKDLRSQLAQAERRAEANVDNLLSECENLRFRLADAERRTQDTSAHVARLKDALLESGFEVAEQVQRGVKSLTISPSRSHAGPPFRSAGDVAALDELATINEIISLAQRDVLLPTSRLLPPIETVQQLAEELRKRDALISELREVALLPIHPLDSTAADAVFEKVRELARLRMAMHELRASASAKSQSQPALLRSKVSAEAERLEGVLLTERQKVRTEAWSHVEHVAALHRRVTWSLHQHRPQSVLEPAHLTAQALPKEAPVWEHQTTRLKTDLDDMKKRTAEIEVRVEHLADTNMVSDVAKTARTAEKVVHVRCQSSAIIRHNSFK